MRRSESGWTLVLPVKGGRRAKSRLGGAAYLAPAIALDTLEAVLGCPEVATAVVVTADPAISGQATALGARVRRERNPGAGLDAAVRQGLTGLAGPVGVLLADLPALRPDDLSQALHAVSIALEPARADAPVRIGAEPPRWVVVPDAEGTGTVLLAGTADAIRPSFGPASAAAHVRLGAMRLDLSAPRLRRDVDTPADLEQAVRLGVGRNVAAALAAPHSVVRLP